MQGLEPEPGTDGGVAECVDGGSGEFDELVVECGRVGQMRWVGDNIGLIFVDWGIRWMCEGIVDDQLIPCIDPFNPLYN